MEKETKNKNVSYSTWMGIGLGTGAGVLMGLLMSNLAIGIPVGLVIGAGAGSTGMFGRKKDSREESNG